MLRQVLQTAKVAVLGAVAVEAAKLGAELVLTAKERARRALEDKRHD